MSSISVAQLAHSIYLPLSPSLLRYLTVGITPLYCVSKYSIDSWSCPAVRLPRPRRDPGAKQSTGSLPGPDEVLYPFPNPISIDPILQIAVEMLSDR